MIFASDFCSRWAALVLVAFLPYLFYLWYWPTLLKTVVMFQGWKLCYKTTLSTQSWHIEKCCLFLLFFCQLHEFWYFAESHDICHNVIVLFILSICFWQLCVFSWKFSIRRKGVVSFGFFCIYLFVYFPPVAANCNLPDEKWWQLVCWDLRCELFILKGIAEPTSWI